MFALGALRAPAGDFTGLRYHAEPRPNHNLREESYRYSRRIVLENGTDTPLWRCPGDQTERTYNTASSPYSISTPYIELDIVIFIFTTT